MEVIMTTARFKTTLVTLTILVALMFSTVLFADCDMMAMIAKKGHYISWNDVVAGDFNDPIDYFNFIRERSTNVGDKPNGDGYGFIYYPEDGSWYYNALDPLDPDNQAWYLTGFDTRYYHGDTYQLLPHYNNDPLNNAEACIMDNATEASIVFGHARQTDSNTGSGSHPFYFDIDGNGIGNEDYYVFMHNGTISPLFKSHISVYLNNLYVNGTAWHTLHPFNSDGNIDSELYFHYLMTYIIEYGNVVEGLYHALNEVDFVYSTGNTFNVRQSIYDETDREANFILSDGETIYAFRNTEMDDTNHCLGFFESGSFAGITTLNHNNYGIEIQQYELAVFTPYGQPENDSTLPLAVNPTRIYKFVKQYDDENYCIKFRKGSIEVNDFDHNYPAQAAPGVVIVGDIDIDVNVQITSGIQVIVAGHHNININAQLKINDNASLNLNHATTVTVDTGGELFLDWGSTITGSTPTTYEATPPGYPAGAEHAIPGDRILCTNGGRITTPNDLQNPGTEITIASYSGDIWDGIQIKNPSSGENNEYWFVNCDISGIRKLIMEANENGNGDLYLYSTNFYDGGSITVRDGHKLTYHGTSEEYSEYQNNQGPICAYESPVDLNYVEVSDNNTGIYLYEAPLRNTSKITYCNVNSNNGDGIKPNNVTFEYFNDNQIEENSSFGMLCYDGTLFYDNRFNDILIRNNGFAEYAGWQTTFEMEHSTANITISDNNYGSGSDNYLLMNVNWDGVNAVDIRGTNITSVDHLFPTNNDAWILSGGIISEAKELLDSAAIDFANEDYENAKQTLHQLLSEYLYSKEAVTAIYYLYHIENLSTEDFAGLRDYLLALNVDEQTHIYDTIKKVSAKTLMKEKDYVTAIDLLETVITNSQIPDEVIMAMIDEGYCYLELADEGERSLPSNCTIKTATIDSYQAKVKELESQFSFFPEEKNENITPITSNILTIANYPNPFNPTTIIKFSLPKDSKVKLSIYNVKGQKVTTVVDEFLEKGIHTVEWKGTDSNKKAVSSGIYFYEISAGKSSKMKKMLLLK